jgi:peptidyl-prolyl cis-trans isomerase SurA
MIKPFEDNAFRLQKEGDYTAPFQTEYGWHILKLVKKIPIESYADLENGLENKIKRGNRSKYVDKALAEVLTKQYKITENLEELSAFYNAGTSKITTSNVLLTIENQNYTTKNFSNYVSQHKDLNIKEAYDDFKTNKIIAYHKEHLEESNKDFALTFKEYKDGLLLFELLQENIWEKSETDSIGLHAYYEENKDKYVWKKRGELTIASCTSKDKAALVKKYLEENKSEEEIKKLLNEGATIHVLFSKGVLEEGNSKLPAEYVLQEGVSKIFEDDKNHFTIIKVYAILPSSIKKLEETKGEVINDYQMYIEEKWVNALRESYEIDINEKAYKKLKKQYADL